MDFHFYFLGAQYSEQRGIETETAGGDRGQEGREGEGGGGQQELLSNKAKAIRAGFMDSIVTNSVV